VLAFVVPLGEFRGQPHPAPLTTHPWRDVELTEHHHRLGPQTRFLPQFPGGKVGGGRFVAVERARGGALRKLPAAQPDRIPELFDETEPVPVAGNHQRVCRFVDHPVDAGGAVGPADVVLPNDHPGIAVDLA
jgi:hypothetical protein